MKIVINVCFGGFGLSQKAKDLYGIKDRSVYTIDRTDPKLVEVVEQLGAEAGDSMAKLKVVEIPDGIEWEVVDYDGWERVHEVHRSWG